MGIRERMIYLVQLLHQGSDKKQRLTTPTILKQLEKRGCKVTTETLRDDIQALQNAGYGIEIVEKPGLPTEYGWLDRDWTVPELQVLIDAVSSCQFIPKNLSQDLIGKLARMAGPSIEAALRPRILTSEHIKAPDKQIMQNIKSIRTAIRNNHQISFRYLRYTVPGKERVPRHQGTPEEVYQLSPYDTVWNSERYYVVGWSEKHLTVTTFRIDRMVDVKMTPRVRIPAPPDYTVQKYTDEVFWMFTGPERVVTLRCCNYLIDQVIDKFGPDIKIRNPRKETFDVSVPVQVSGTFLAWVFQFAGEMAIIAPDDVKDLYASRLQDALDDALS